MMFGVQGNMCKPVIRVNVLNVLDLDHVGRPGLRECHFTNA